MGRIGHAGTQGNLSGLRFAVATPPWVEASSSSGLPCAWWRCNCGTQGLPLALFGFRLPARHIFRSSNYTCTSICPSYVTSGTDFESFGTCSRRATR